jgi:ribokinase
LTDLHAVGFGSLNLDEFWEVTPAFLEEHNLVPGHEYVRDVTWFQAAYDALRARGRLKASDPGGSAANAIAALKRMGFRTGFYGAAGRPDMAALRLDELGAPGDLRVQGVEIPAGRCLAFIDEQDSARDRALVILPNANDLAGVVPAEPEYFGTTQWVHLTSFVSPEPLQAQIKVVESLPARVRISFDPGVVYATLGLDKLEPLVRRADVLFVSREELHMLTHLTSPEDAAKELLRLGVRLVVVKLGAEGIQAIMREGKRHQHAVPPRDLRDRTGAGDVAAAGFLAGMIHSLSVDVCLRLAASAASRSIEGYGRSTYPDKAFLDAFLARERGN